MSTDTVSLGLTVSSALGAYEVTIAAGLVTDPARSSRLFSEAGDPVVVVDERVRALHPGLPWFSDPDRIIELRAEEDTKTLAGAARLYDAFSARNLRRTGTVVVIGGGIIQDVAGFACNSFLRGVPWWFLPTTLLAQADSCIGAKTSLNYAAGKNLLGAFARPDRILVDPLLLRTLDRRDLASGCGELLKVFIMGGREHFDRFAGGLGSLLDADPEVCTAQIHAALALKADYVRQDEFDRGIRQLLNYGHEFGHALEAATQFAVPHGIAVALGIDFANRLASIRGSGSPDLAQAALAVAARLADHLDLPDVSWNELLHQLGRDKKRVGKNLTVVLGHDFGRVAKHTDVTAEDAARAVAGMSRLPVTDLPDTSPREAA
ncbi:3-dehydroquinate synthase [Streptomyces sp. SID4928]|uniref:3-dehydroquinate synthase n=1 Tax=unclassified Streptomyces TaxID=2593676 RepID=UPI0001C19C26|nr:3-dehydroquinate synthase family protein [Streptomyces sp. ACT-1]EGE39620.1 3-dehydroquinate synthase [Streptomyces sp. ACT-1]MYR47709.1 3-dehydroquinate synthase [Streptomyces sp. SID4928]